MVISVIERLDSLLLQYVKNQISYENYKTTAKDIIQEFITKYELKPNEIKEFNEVIALSYAVDFTN